MITDTAVMMIFDTFPIIVLSAKQRLINMSHPLIWDPGHIGFPQPPLFRKSIQEK